MLLNAYAVPAITPNITAIKDWMTYLPLSQFQRVWRRLSASASTIQGSIFMRNKINPETDACSRGHVGRWAKQGQLQFCRTCKSMSDRRRRAATKALMTPLRTIYESRPGSVKKAAELLHVTTGKVRDALNGWRHVPRWQINQLKAVLELCIQTNGHFKAESRE